MGRARLDRRADRRDRTAGGKIEVAVHLVARDKAGKVLNESEGRHVYEFL